jgi:hypothetical protein
MKLLAKKLASKPFPVKKLTKLPGIGLFLT